MSLKQQLLTALEQHRDTFLSGQKLADALGVSRNAVWKAICCLLYTSYGCFSEGIPIIFYQYLGYDTGL